MADPPKRRITLRCLLKVLRNETTARRGGVGSSDGIEERCSGLKSAAEVRIEVPGNARASPSDRRTKALPRGSPLKIPLLRLQGESRLVGRLAERMRRKCSLRPSTEWLRLVVRRMETMTVRVRPSNSGIKTRSR